MPSQASQLGPGGGDPGSDREAEEPWVAPPIFECYWQGRLIPGAKLDTLPFLEALRTNRTASGKVRGR